VRAENLRFREEGVKEVVARVLLPWINSFRFFLGQVALLERDAGIKFMYNPHAPLSTNIMDRWVLARCQSLIKLVREEMTGEHADGCY
jgi:isoleucyl-tRNA synthetase